MNVVTKWKIMRWFRRPVMWAMDWLWWFHPHAAEDWVLKRLDSFERETARCIEDWVYDE